MAARLRAEARVVRPRWWPRLDLRGSGGGRAPCGESVSVTKPGTEALTAGETGVKNRQTSHLALTFCERLMLIIRFVLHSSTWRVKVAYLL